ncbi:hypothetical protein [Xenorhabdus bovienii]|uniref:hypothetical protein n=1 Tax=Xenorhabdus bovienii TaxID=40576 RepID=UPI0023B243AA|nr:hypothetical protein [Xenorhabdus bovienii]MDE9429839.1 hypothetical protein [Xenorhabdus bovienii]
MDNQIFKEGQCLRSNLNDDYIVSEIKDINGICSYVLLSLKSQVATILSHATIVRSGWKPLDQMVSSKDIYQRKKDD